MGNIHQPKQTIYVIFGKFDLPRNNGFTGNFYNFLKRYIWGIFVHSTCIRLSLEGREADMMEHTDANKHVLKLSEEKQHEHLLDGNQRSQFARLQSPMV